MKSTSGDRPYVEVWIQSARALARCDWCGGTGEKMPRIGLCRPCNEVRKHLLKTKQWVSAKRPSANRHNQFMLDRELAIAEKMKQLCIADGNALRGTLEGEVSPLDLEHWFTALARNVAREPRKRRRLHNGTASQLGWSFSPSQRQLLAYLFCQIFHAQWQFNRRRRAENLYSRDLIRSAERSHDQT